MFSGIVEATAPILSAKSSEGLVRIQVQKPEFFDDLKIGDSVAVDGACLTVEKFDQDSIQFALAAESLKVLRWPEAEKLMGRILNLERSLRFGDRIHGHLVSGHVEGLGEVREVNWIGESLILKIELPKTVKPYIWKKGSITLHGVSLTINDIQNLQIEVCLIPETQKRTNLSLLKVGDFVHVEPDWMARALEARLPEGLGLK